MNRRKTITTTAALACMTGLGGFTPTASAQDNVWLAAGAGFWLEWGFPLNWVFDDIHYTAAAVGQHFRDETIADVTDWVSKNLGVDIEIAIESNAGIEIPGVGEVNVGKAGVYINGAPPIDTGRSAARGGFGGFLDLNGDGALDIPLWEVPGDVNAMVVTTYSFGAGMADMYLVEPAPVVDEDDLDMPVHPPVPGDPGFTFTPLGVFPIDHFHALAVPQPASMFFMIPEHALFPGSPELHEKAGITFAPPGGCNPADLAPPLGSLDFSDVVAFLSAFGAMDPAADLAPPFGSFDFSDVVAFLSAFGAGCP